MKKLLISIFTVLFMVNTTFASFAQGEYGDKFEEALETIYENYYYNSDITKEKLYEMALSGMLGSLDKYSEFIPKSETEEFYNLVNNVYVGIGVVLAVEDKKTKIERVIDEGPASKAGVKVNDIIKEIDGKDVNDLSLVEIAKMCRGESGTTVEIVFIRNDAELTLKIVREKVQLKAAWEEDISSYLKDVDKEKSSKIGMIVIDSFTETVHEEIEQIMNSFEERGIKNVIVDLRDNSGGYIHSAVKSSEFFTGTCYAVILKDNKGGFQKYISADRKEGRNIVAIINENSASATEFVAQAIREDGGTLVGEKTYGKGVAQTLFTMEDGSELKLTTYSFYSGEDVQIDKVGVEPDIKVEMPKYVKNVSKFHFGDSYDEVLDLEKNLTYLGYDVGVPDKYYGAKTVKAVKDIQANNGLYSYGVCDYTTQDMINKLVMDKVMVDDVQLKTALKQLIENME